MGLKIFWHLINYLWRGIFLGYLYRLPAFGNGKLVFSGSSHKDTPFAMRCWKGKTDEDWMKSYFQQRWVRQFAFLKGQCRGMDIIFRRSKHFLQYFVCIIHKKYWRKCWWFSRVFTIPYPVINFLVASLTLLTNFENSHKPYKNINLVTQSL
jgi:hypothetical protein